MNLLNLYATNRICPRCKNPNYMVSLSGVSDVFQYKCINCNSYFTYDDFTSKTSTIKNDMVKVVRCKDCKHRPTQTEPPKTYGFSIEFPEGSKCPCQCEDGYYSWYPKDNWFCANGESNKGGENT